MEISLDLKHALKNFLNKDNQYTIPIFIPHKGCPNSCVFCNQKKISGQIKNVSLDEVDSKIQEYLGYYTNKEKKIEIAFFGGSFTGIDINDQEAYLKIAYKYIEDGKVDSIRLSTRPDYINTEILDLLKKYGVGTIELGVQSMDDNILNIAKRGHTSLDVVNASNLINSYGIRLGHQVMIGLPESTLESEIYTIKECLKLNPKQLRIYPVYVIGDSELYDMYKDGRYVPLTIAQAVKRTIEVVHYCQETDISIIRLGLQSTDEITSSNANIYGPVSDNLAEYVMAGVIREEIEKQIKNIGNMEQLIVHIPSKYVSVTIGPKKVNKIYFEQKYNMKYVVKGDF